MEINIREYRKSDIPSMIAIWNQIVEDANAFPQVHKLKEEEAEQFFAEQTVTVVATLENHVVGLYILHPNNIGRCGHIANASYAVAKQYRGYQIGEKLVRHSLLMGKKSGFLILQFNAVVSSNVGAIHLYEKLGFHRVGIIPNGYLLNGGCFEDIIIYYIEL